MTRFSSYEQLVAGRSRGNQLMVSGMGLTPDEAQLLWDSPQLREISWLDLEDNRLGDAGVAGLAACEHAVNLQVLSLSKNQISDAGVMALAASPHLAKLKRLHLKDNSIKGPGIIALFESPTLGNLTIFHINTGWSCRKREGWRYKPQDAR